MNGVGLNSTLQVLAFEEQPSSKHFGVSCQSRKLSGLSPVHSRSQSQPLSSVSKQTPILRSNSSSKRARAPSDPFLDLPSRPKAVTSLNTAITDEPLKSPIGPDNVIALLQLENPQEDVEEEEYMRVWTSPDISNPEIPRLLKLFPSFVSRRTLPRFTVPTTARPTDIEEGEYAYAGQRVQFGTGSMWVSSRQRSDGWEGSWWARFVLRWRRIFC